MGHLFWLSDAQWAVIEPLLPNNKGGARRVDDRRVISGIIHVLKVGCRWCDCPADYGPSTTIYNRFNRWSHKRFWVDLVEALATSGAVTKSTAIDSTYVKAHRSAHGGKGGRKIRRSGRLGVVKPPKSTFWPMSLAAPLRSNWLVAMLQIVRLRLYCWTAWKVQNTYSQTKVMTQTVCESTCVSQPSSRSFQAAQIASVQSAMMSAVIRIATLSKMRSVASKTSDAWQLAMTN